MRNNALFWLESLNGRNHLGNVGLVGEVILQWILGKFGGKV